jgi:hypothetical protein
MILRVYMLRPGWMDSDIVQSLPDHLQLFFLRLGHACDGAGRFENHPRKLRSALYPIAQHKVSERDVASNLVRMHDAGLVKFYTVAGRGYGEVLKFGQLDSKRKVIHPGPDEADRPPDLFTSAPPPPPIERNGNELKRRGAREARETPPPPPRAEEESEQAWKARLAAQYPDVDIDDELKAAAKKRRVAGAKVTREWFANHWLPNCGIPVSEPAAPAPKVDVVAEVPGWQALLVEIYPPEEHAATRRILASGCWIDVPQSIRREIREKSCAARLPVDANVIYSEV